MGIPITATLTTYAGGVYPTHNDQLGWGGCRVVADHAARNAIATNSSRLGMLVITQADAAGIVWQLTTYPPTGADGDWTQLPSGGGGVTTASVVTANGFAGTVATATTTPAFTLSTTVTGIIKGNGTAISAATAGTDYVVPAVTALSSLAITESQVTGLVSDLSTLAAAIVTTAANAAIADNLTSGTVPAGRLPNPSASTLGGVQSAAAVSHEWINSISTAGVPSLSQPAFTDISGITTTAQLGATVRTFTAILGQGVPVAVLTNAAGNYLVCSNAGTFARWDLAAVTAPVGASLVIDVLKSANQGSTWTSLWASNPSNRPTLTTTVNSGGGTSFDTTTFAAGDWLRFDVITVGSSTAGQNITLEILGHMNQ